MQNNDKLEYNTTKTMKFLRRTGYKNMDYPRWQSIRYCAKYLLGKWQFYQEQNHIVEKRQVLLVIAFQPFSGLRGEWSEETFGTWEYCSNKDIT